MLRIRIERTEAPRSASRRRAITLTAAAIVAGVLVTGVSYAYWTATGSGTATVGSGTAQTMTIAASSPVVSDMYPGKAKQALTFTVTNPNPYAVQLNASPTIGAGTSSNEVACPYATSISVAPGPLTMTGTLLVPASGTVTLSVAAYVQLVSGALDGCQSKTFTFPVSVTGTQT